MAAIVSNRSQVSRALHILANSLNLRNRSPLGNRRLGDELVDAAAAAIRERSVTKQADPSGNPWKRLSPRYLRRKLRQGYPATIGVRTGEMLDPEQVRGRTVVTANAAAMTAGLDAETQQKAEWFQEGGARNRPARPFYDLGREGEAAADLVVTGAIDRAVAAAEQA